MKEETEELCALLAWHCPRELTATAIPRLTLSRSQVPTELTAVVYYPLFCLIAQGRKRVFLGEEEFQYDPASYLIASVDLPVTGQVIEAPCLGLTLALEPEALAALLLDMPPVEESYPTPKAMKVNPLDEDLLDPILRLLRLLDRPQEISMLAPLIEREILYRLGRGAKCSASLLCLPAICRRLAALLA
jgi:hypothetical protein